MDALVGRKPGFGTILNAILDPIVTRARTRKKSTQSATRNRTTVKNIRNVFTNTNAKQRWLNDLHAELEPKVAWVEKKSKSTGKPYWYNPVTKESVWENPAVKLASTKAEGKAQSTMEVAPAVAPPAPKKGSKLAKAVTESLAALPPPPPVAAPPATGTFPTLYSKSKAGKTQVWKIEVTKGPGEGATIKTSYGYEGGAMQENQKEILKGKVKRSAWEQAISEAQSDWKKKKDKGYAEALGNAHVPGVAGEAAVAAHKTLLPMLAHDYHKRGKSIVFPAYVQAKLDGVRSIFHNGILSSRMGKPFSGLEHITGELGPATAAGLILDGEVYSTTLPFQQFVGLVKKKKFTAADMEQLKQVNLWVYDCVNDKPFDERLAMLKDFFAKNKFAHVKLLPTQEAAAAADLKKFHDAYVAEGYEGLIVRNKKGAYHLATRSADLQKYKEFEDDEYEVVGFTEGEGHEKGLVIWTCKTKDGKKFNVRPRGTHEERAALFKEAETYVGKKLTVRFQELTGDGIPRFPVGISFRDYE
jgi:ATP-dependent DNA ligase